MNVKELVGKKAIRTGPVDLRNGHKDYSYTTDGLLILAVTESHIIYEHCDGYFKDKRSILDNRWLDENWGDYDELMRLANETKCGLQDTFLALSTERTRMREVKSEFEPDQS